MPGYTIPMVPMPLPPMAPMNLVASEPEHWHTAPPRWAKPPAAPHAPARAPASLSEGDAKLAQKLGQLQPSLAAFLLECVGQLASFGAT